MKFQLTILGACAAATLAIGMATQPQQPAQPAEPEQRPQSFGVDLYQGLLKTEGCLGAEVGSFQSGKRSIFAWFKDKDAAIRWYDSKTHRKYMNTLESMYTGEEPLEHAEDDVPIMVIATITVDRNSPAGEVPEFSQISIELFRTIPGGGSYNGRLSPEGFKVPNMRAYSKPEPADN